MNTYNNQNSEQTVVSKPAAPKPGKIGRIIQRTLSGDFLLNKSLIKHLPFISFVVFLFILNIGLVYYFENSAREKVRLQNEINELRSQYNTTMSKLETSKQQSQVAEAINDLGLKELNAPPTIIDVEPGFLESE